MLRSALGDVFLRAEYAKPLRSIVVIPGARLFGRRGGRIFGTHKGQSALDSLDEVDRLRLMMFNRRVVVHWHNMFAMRMQNLLPDTDWNELRWLIKFFSSNQALLETWGVFKPSFERGFQEFIDERFSAGDGNLASH